MGNKIKISSPKDVVRDSFRRRHKKRTRKKKKSIRKLKNIVERGIIKYMSFPKEKSQYPIRKACSHIIINSTVVLWIQSKNKRKIVKHVVSL